VPGEFLIAESFADRRKEAGYTYRGLGLYLLQRGSPKGRRPPKWCLVHLGSGHTVCYINGHVKDGFPLASEIAECGDWTFDGLTGWRNVDPEIPAKFHAIREAHPKAIELSNGGSSEEAARAVVMARST
jgi:hypothetical protein